MKELFTKARWLSLDIVLGADILLFFICKEHGLNIPIPIIIALSVAIWLIYTLDHLNDVRSLLEPSSERHQFHKQNFKAILRVAITAFFVGLVNIYWLSIEVVQIGIVVTVFSVIYLFLQAYIARYGFKEVIISFGYAIGIFIYPFTEVGLSSVLILQFVQLVLLAFMNIILLALYEEDLDKKDGVYSLVIRFGRQPIKWVFYVSGVLLLSLIAISYQSGYGVNFMLFAAISLLILILILLFPQIFRSGDRYRLFADGIFFIPLVFLFS